ncbi:MAG: hypothetical protein J7K73_00335 [Nanoarchaeota archaeon]|nr:hypothetical protein [Nanoarchaeota archaeon]
MVDWYKEFGYGKYKFTLAEIRDLTISALILGFLFSIALGTFKYVSPISAVKNFLVALVIVAPALIFHELAHKFMAQRYDCKAAYVLWPNGAIMSLILTLITGGRVIFAALGAVMIDTTYSTRLGYRFIGLSSEEIGKISVVGPLTNLGLALLGFLIYSINPIIIGTFIQINLIIALFNLIPFPPLDGVKIFSWSRVIWGGMIAATAALYFLPPIIGVLMSIIVAILVGALIFVLARLISPWKHPKKEHVF